MPDVPPVKLMPAAVGFHMRRTLALAAAAALLAAGGAGAATTLPGFRSPSRNIRCFRNAEAPRTLHCTIASAAYAKRLTAYCGAPPIGVDWGGFELGPTRKGSVTCTGGVLYSPGSQRLSDATLAYGATWRSGPFTCASRVAGVTCRSRAGHGIFLSRASYRLW
jgi:hypothetical protein